MSSKAWNAKRASKRRRLLFIHSVQASAAASMTAQRRSTQASPSPGSGRRASAPAGRRHHRAVLCSTASASIPATFPPSDHPVGKDPPFYADPLHRPHALAHATHELRRRQLRAAPTPTFRPTLRPTILRTRSRPIHPRRTHLHPASAHSARAHPHSLVPEPLLPSCFPRNKLRENNDPAFYTDDTCLLRPLTDVTAYRRARRSDRRGLFYDLPTTIRVSHSAAYCHFHRGQAAASS